MITNGTKLRGGLNGNSSGRSALAAALAEVSRTTVPQTRQKLDFLSATPTTRTAGGMTATEIAKHVMELAEMGYQFVSEVARPEIMSFYRELEEVGEEVGLEFVDEEMTREDRCQRYEKDVEGIRQFVADNDPTERLQKEIKQFPGKKVMIERICLRVRQMAEIAVLTFDLAHATSREDLENLLANATDGIDSEEKVFRTVTTSEGKAQLWAFRQGYEIVPGTFAGYYNFAVEKFADAIRTRSRELATEHSTEESVRRQETLAPNANRVTAEELLFGDPREINGKEAVLEWIHRRQKNATIVQRTGNQLFIIGAVGAMVEQDFARMKERMGPKPFVLLSRILDKDGQHLCSEENADGKLRYQFADQIPEAQFKMSCWVRTGAGASCPSRIIGGETAAKRPSKPLGELLTDKEFFDEVWLGEYDLVFPSGFNFEDRESDNFWELEHKGVVRIERKQTPEGDKIVVKSASTEELALFMVEACGAENYGPHEEIFAILGEYQEGTGGAMLPKVLAIGLKLAYGRMKSQK